MGFSLYADRTGFTLGEGRVLIYAYIKSGKGTKVEQTKWYEATTFVSTPTVSDYWPDPFVYVSSV